MIYLFLSVAGNYVSLPGAANNNSNEQPTILEVLNKVNVITTPATATGAAAAADEYNKIRVVNATIADTVKETEILEQADTNIDAKETHHIDVDDNVDVAKATDIEEGEREATSQQSQATSDNLVSSSNNAATALNDSNILKPANADSNTTTAGEAETATPTTLQAPSPAQFLNRQTSNSSSNASQEHVLDIESHLIENCDEYKATDDSVHINELTPIKDELTQGTSKIETDINVRSIIEVEPAGVRTKRPLLVQAIHTHLTAAVIDDNVVNGTETLQQHLSEEIIKEAAEKLVNEIEKEVLATLLTQQINALDKEKDVCLEVNTSDSDAAESIEQIQIKTEKPNSLLDEINTTLSQKVDEQLSEVTSILKASSLKKHADVQLNLSGADGEQLSIDIDKPQKAQQELKIVNVPSPKTPSEAEEKKLFIESLPHIETDADANKLAADCKREYYQSLRKYLVQDNTDKPPVPLQTYRWEDLKRAKERGGYPWTHLYKRPLGPDEEPEIVLMLRKSQELRFTSESPKSFKKVRIDEQVLVKEAERYINDLSDYEDDGEDEQQQHRRHNGENEDDEDEEESHSLHSESHSCVSDSVLAANRPRKSNRFTKFRDLIKRHKSGRSSEDAQSLPGTSTNSSRHHSQEHIAPAHPQLLGNGKQAKAAPKTPRCYPIMKKLKSMADRQKKRLQIKRITLKKDEKIVLCDEPKILKLKHSPKSDRGEIPHFIEKQDSDDVLEIVELDESPSRKRKDDGREEDDEAVSKEQTLKTSIVQPDEIIEINNALAADAVAVEKPESTQAQESETKSSTAVIEQQVEKVEATIEAAPPKKTPRLRREHVYEEIEQTDMTGEQAGDVFQLASVEALKQSLAKQDNTMLKDIHEANKAIPLDRMGSSEEEQIAVATSLSIGAGDAKPTMSLIAPISSIDSTSSDEDRNRTQLSPVDEESEMGSVDMPLTDKETAQILHVIEEQDQAELKSSMKKEASPAPSDKKVTFSHVEDEAEPHREDIELPENVQKEANAAAASKKWKDMNDHEYEPIGVPPTEDKSISKLKEPSPAPQQLAVQNEELKISMDTEESHDGIKAAEELQRNFEDRYFTSAATTPRPESRLDNELPSTQVDASALDEAMQKPENRLKGFMASAQDRTRKMQAGFKNQAGKIKTKLRTPTKKPPSGSPKAKERRRFKAPEFSKIKMPEIKRPDMSKLKEFKRPEFTKFNKPDMSKFKIPEKFSTLKLRRSKSLKENEAEIDDEMSGVTPESTADVHKDAQPQKKMFEFNFGTYPRAFRKKKKPIEPQSSFGTDTNTEGLSVIPSTETQPSVESSSSPQGDRGPGPVRSRWADKFSDVSYNDSEGSRYRRYGSEQESFDRESSLERRMKEDLEETGSETQELGILGGVARTQQYAEFDEENRAIHEISNLRSGEFKRRPMIHQDSDLRSEDSKDAVGWTDKEIQKNKLLRKAELEAEASYLKYPVEDVMTHETQSTASSGKKVVMEEIDDDEFFLRKRGISEDNIELRQYISDAIREGYDMPINALQHVGETSEPMEYGDYDVPPPKPRRLHRSYRPEDVSQEFETQRSDYGDDLSMSQNGSDFLGAPKRPLRKGRHRSKYSMDSQDIPMADETISREQYFDDDEEYLRPPRAISDYKQNDLGRLNNLNLDEKSSAYAGEQDETDDVLQPQPPRRRKRQLRETSMEKDSYINGFSGRSVSNSYLQKPDDVIVYRTEHEYPIPLATPENLTDGASSASRKSRSASRYDEDDRTSRGVDSLAVDNHRAAYEEDEDATETAEDVHEKYIIDMMENDGYAIVRKEPIPKPTPPARRKKFSRSPGERFATMPNMRSKRSTPPPERPPPPRGYMPSTDDLVPPPRRKSATSLEATQNYEDDYEEPEILESERAESPRDLQSGEVINKMKYRPLPPPPRPPREKRQRAESKSSTQGTRSDLDLDSGTERIATSSTADSYDQNEEYDEEQRLPEVEVSTQTDPLPDDFVCEEFEITDDMKVIEPRRPPKTLEELLREEQAAAEADSSSRQLTEDEQLAMGLQRFREANQRSMSERSRASSQADRSKSLSRPATPSAIVIERRVSTPVPPTTQQGETMLEASLIVRPIDDLDLEEEALRREGLLTDSSQHSKSDAESRYQGDEEESKFALSDFSQAPSSAELDAAVEGLRSQIESEIEAERDDEEVERTMRDYEYVDERVKRYASHYDEEEDYKLSDEELLKAAEEDYKLSDVEPQKTDEEDYRLSDVERIITDEEDYKLSDAEQRLVDEIKKLSEHTLGTFEEKILQEQETEAAASEAELEYKEDVKEDPIKYDYERKTSAEREHYVAEPAATEDEILTEEPPPQPPPRRKSTTAIDTAAVAALSIVEQQAQDVAPMQTVAPTQAQLPGRIGDLEVERLRVHALQAGQIMVSQLHGSQISSDELECKSGNLFVKNIELPPGFIEDIVERVRSTDRGPLLTVETQTSREASSEKVPTENQQPSPVRESVPPPKPPRHKDLEAAAMAPVHVTEYPAAVHAMEHLSNLDEQTQTDVTLPAPPLIYPTAEYLQSLAPLAFYNLRRDEAEHIAEESTHRHRHHHHHLRHHHRRYDSSSSELDEPLAEEGEEIESEQQGRRSRTRTRSRSRTQPRELQQQGVAQAGRQFISACSLSLVNIINQLTGLVRGDAVKEQENETRVKYVPTLVVLFIVITFGLLLFLLSGRNVHTHHWDYFNPPGNEGRPS